MSATSYGKNPIEVVIWTDTQSAGRDGQIVDELGPAARAIGVGGPRSGDVDALARRLDCPHLDDLRQMMMDRPGVLLLLGTTAGADSQDIASAVAQGALVLALEPPAATLGQLPLIDTRSEPSGANSARTDIAQLPDAGGRIVTAPAFERSAGWIGAADPLEILGPPESISFVSFGQSSDCSLFARLMDAWRSVLSLCDQPSSIDASLSGPLGRPPEDLRGLTGHVAAHGRLPDGGSVLLQASDRAGNHLRALHAISTKGRLAVTDLRYDLCDATGNVMDQMSPSVEPVAFVDLVADHCRQLLREARTSDLRAAAQFNQLELSALACCQACLLSARTGEPESPAKLMELQRRG